MSAARLSRHALFTSLFLLALLWAHAGFCGYTADCNQAPTWQTGSWTEQDCLTFEKALDDAAKPATPGKTTNSLLAIVPLDNTRERPACLHGLETR